MTNQVQITLHPETGKAVNPTNNPEIFRMRVEQKTNTFNNGFARVETRSALINGPEELLNTLAKGKVIQGKIVVQESFEPFYVGQTPKINPDTHAVVEVNGQPVYRNTVFTQDLSVQDVFVRQGVSASVVVPAGVVNGEN